MKRSRRRQFLLDSARATRLERVSPVILAGCLFGGAVAAQGVLEIPSPNSVNSGIGVVSGWHCTARRIEVVIDDYPPLLAGSGTERLDTVGVCGHPNTGYALLFNWNVLPKNCFGCRYHHVKVMADGLPFAESTFQIENFGVAFMTGKVASYRLPNFPELGSDTWLRWDEAKQNFAIDLGAPLQRVVPGTYYGAVRIGAQNPICGPFPIGRVLPIKHASFIVGFDSGRATLSVQYADGAACQVVQGGMETPDSRTSDGNLHILFDSAATASCAEFPGGLDMSFNGDRLHAKSMDTCATAELIGAK